MTPTQGGNHKATGRQLAYLKSLAARTGQTFTWPQNRSHVSREIRRLQGVRGDGFTFGELDVEQAAHQAHHAPVARNNEIAGYGASATWRHRA